VIKLDVKELLTHLERFGDLMSSILAWKLKKMSGNKNSKGYMFPVIFGHFFAASILLGFIPVALYWFEGTSLSWLLLADMILSTIISLLLTSIVYVLHKMSGEP
jgi:hypothetical protein